MSPSNYHDQTAEHARLEQSSERQANWQRWGTYLSERQWGTVRWVDVRTHRRIRHSPTTSSRKVQPVPMTET